MAMNPAPARRSARRSPLWTRLHFLVHLVGLAGFLALTFGLVWAHARGRLPGRQLAAAADACLQGEGRQAWSQLTGAADGFQTAMRGSEQDAVIGYVILAGATAVLLYLLIEAVIAAVLVAGRRSALGASAAVQIGLAVLVFVCVNVWSFRHPTRYDWTREQQFTLPEDVVSRLQKLDPPQEGAADRRTTVIVYQRHKTFGSLSDKPDRYDYAAERKVVEKVKDLADQLRRLGKQLRVEVLDVEAEDYKDRLTALTKDAPQLQQAIEAAPENSLFFTARGSNGRLYVQRLSFNDFYLLDKKASEEANGGKGNLVLRYQGMEPFARRILNLEERPPRVGIAVIHDILSSEGHEIIGLAGLRAALQMNGFEVRDIILKKDTEMGMQAAAATRDESRLAELDASQTLYEDNLRTLQKVRTTQEEALKLWQKALTDPKTRADLERRLANQLDGSKLTDEQVEDEVDFYTRRIQQVDAALVNQQQKHDRVVTEKKGLNVPQLREQQRMTDVRAKMDRLLADCDVLLIPRLTLRNTANRAEMNYPSSWFKLDATQVDAIKEFLKVGKPVLACFGPSNEPPRGPMAPPPADEGPDPLEKALAEVGFRFGKETILFFDEMDAFAKRRAGLDVAGATTIPAVRLDWAKGEGRPEGSVPSAERDNPLRDSLQLLARSLGKDQGLDIRIRHPRPIYFVPPKDRRPPFDPIFLMSSENSWNEDRPFPADNYIPQFQRFDEDKNKTADKAKDSKKEDPLEKRRRGPFPIGVAVEVQLPESWYGNTPEKAATKDKDRTAEKTKGDTKKDGKKPATVRLAAIGQSWFFVGKDLSSSSEEKSAGVLMVDTLNWLLGRDDYLPHAGQVWSYPRVDLPEDSEEGKLWRWGVFGLPLLSAALGILVWLLRRIH